MPIQEGRAGIPFDPDDLLPQLQQTLGISNRKRLVLRLEELRREARGLEPATPQRIDH